MKRRTSWVVIILVAGGLFAADPGVTSTMTLGVSTGLQYTFGSNAVSLFDSRNGLNGGSYTLSWDLSTRISGAHLDLRIPSPADGTNTVAAGTTTGNGWLNVAQNSTVLTTSLLQTAYGWIYIDDWAKVTSGIFSGSPWSGLDPTGASYLGANKGTLQLQFLPDQDFTFGGSYQFSIQPNVPVARDVVLGVKEVVTDLVSMTSEVDLQFDQYFGVHQANATLAYLGLTDWTMTAGVNLTSPIFVDNPDFNTWIYDASLSYSVDKSTAFGASVLFNQYGPLVGNGLGYSASASAGMPLDVAWGAGLGLNYTSGQFNAVTKLPDLDVAVLAITPALRYQIDSKASLTLMYNFAMSAWGNRTVYFGEDWFQHRVTLDARWTF